MSRIICDICGTTYQDTAECCPICGCTRDSAAELLAEDLLAEEALEGAKAKGGKFSSKKKKEIFDFDEANSELENDPFAEEENPFEDEDDYEEEPKHNTFVVILLTVLIVALLAAAGFIFVRYFLPNIGGGETASTTEPVQTEAVAQDTTERVIPCQMLALTSGTAELTQEGQHFLLNVIVTPEDTTDELVFTSADESIATVSEDGKITAVSEGETIIYITCGTNQIPCPVVVRYQEETTSTEETSDGETTDETTDETAGETTDETTDETASENEDDQDSDGELKDVVLKLKKNDITLGVFLSVQLILDCDLEPTEVEWSSEHPHIVKVDEEGNVTALKSGVTDVIVKYGNQQVVCKVRVP